MTILIILIIILSVVYYNYTRIYEGYVDIKKVINQDDYSIEKKKISYSDIKKPRESLRFFLDENRHNFIEDIPFTPHTILKSYDDISVSNKIKIDNKLENIDVLDKYFKKTYENEDDYCIRNKHLLQCILLERQYKCLGKIEFTKKECEAETDQIGNRVKPGIWDRPCIANEECPYYRANKNYPNEFGKCNGDGYCELPKGLKRAGYRKYLKNDLPYCYNCKDEKTGKIIVDKCCNKQKNPDYVFRGDLRIRHKYEKQLKEKGLSIYTNDNYNKEFRDLEKKLSGSS